MSDALKYKNTFAEHVTNEELTLDNIIFGLLHGVFRFSTLPEQIQKDVRAELDRLKKIKEERERRENESANRSG